MAWFSGPGFHTRRVEAWVARGDSSDVPVPRITPTIVMSAHRDKVPVTPVFDEFDKWKKTSEFQVNTFAKIIDTVIENGGQVIVAANAEPNQMSGWMQDEGGRSILRRFIEGPLSVIIDFFLGQVFVNSYEYVLKAVGTGDDRHWELVPGEGRYTQHGSNLFNIPFPEPTGKPDWSIFPSAASDLPGPKADIRGHRRIVAHQNK